MNHHQICVNSLLSNILFIFRVHYVVHLCKKDRGGPVWMGMIRTHSLYLGHCCNLKVFFGEKKDILITRHHFIWTALFCTLGEKIALSRRLLLRTWKEGKTIWLNVDFSTNMPMCNVDGDGWKHMFSHSILNHWTKTQINALTHSFNLRKDSVSINWSLRIYSKSELLKLCGL